MATYHHACNTCEHNWLEEYSFEEYDRLKAAGENLGCPECDSDDTGRKLPDDPAPIHFKGGGWSPDGYYKNGAYDQHQKEGKAVQLYDRKEDLQRDMVGEAKRAELTKLKRTDTAARRHMGPDAGLTQREADISIEKAGEAAKNR
jgi:hypothetical protein